MDISALLVEAANLMLTGMIVVFIFLSILILTIKGMSRALLPFQDEKPVRVPAKLVSQGVPQAHVAAIAAAIKQYKKQ